MARDKRLDELTEVTELNDDDIFPVKQGNNPLRKVKKSTLATHFGGNGNGTGTNGLNGWTPVLSLVSDGNRRVQQVIDWTGGQGTKPAVGRYVGALGLTTVLADAVDVRGAQGLQGIQGDVGPQGEQGETGAQGEAGPMPTPAQVSATNAIPFNNIISIIAPLTITGAITFTVNNTGAIAGYGAMRRVTANGTNVPAFSGFKKSSGSQNYINTNGVVNNLLFWYDGVDYWYSVYQDAADAGPSLIQLSTPTLTAGTPTDTTIPLTWTNVSNESSYRIDRSTDNSTWTQIGGTIAANTTSYTATSLAPETLYYFRIKAVGDGVTYSDSGYGTDDATTEAEAGYDTDAQNYFDRLATAGYSATTDEKTAWNNFVVSSRADGTYAKYKYYYPYYGSTTAQRQLNAISSSYTQTWGSGVSFVNGVKGDGTANGYINTGLTPSTALSLTSSTYGFWITENITGLSDAGCMNSLDAIMLVNVKYSDGNGYFNMFKGGGGSSAIGVAAANASGFWTVSRTANNSLVVYRNGVSVASSSTIDAAVSLPTIPFYLLANNNAGSVADPSTRTHKIDYVADGFSATDASNAYTNTNTFLTAIGR